MKFQILPYYTGVTTPNNVNITNGTCIDNICEKNIQKLKPYKLLIPFIDYYSLILESTYQITKNSKKSKKQNWSHVLDTNEPDIKTKYLIVLKRQIMDMAMIKKQRQNQNIPNTCRLLKVL